MKYLHLYLFKYGQVVFWNHLSVDKYTFLRFRHPCWSSYVKMDFKFLR